MRGVKDSFLGLSFGLSFLRIHSMTRWDETGVHERAGDKCGQWEGGGAKLVFFIE